MQPEVSGSFVVERELLFRSSLKNCAAPMLSSPFVRFDRAQQVVDLI